MNADELMEIAVEVDGEAAEAVAELFNRFNGGDWVEDSRPVKHLAAAPCWNLPGYDSCGRPEAASIVTSLRPFSSPAQGAGKSNAG